ncbi:unnamed protein product [Mytilus coruscus]|uniref:Uncharacterized protein n=1 Tax=Mytilus coruscus TaxID=42192 RepID=A0A6J8CFB4_MYTCO|nr:unnamed protein product [Mytilus coruscus]
MIIILFYIGFQQNFTFKIIKQTDAFDSRGGDLVSTYYHRDGIHLTNQGTIQPLGNINRVVNIFIRTNSSQSNNENNEQHGKRQSIVRHILSKFDELKNIITINNRYLDLFGLVETFLKPDINNEQCKVPGYKIFRKDRQSKDGGGLLVYVKDSIAFECCGVNSYKDFHYFAPQWNRYPIANGTNITAPITCCKSLITEGDISCATENGLNIYEQTYNGRALG